MFNLSNICNNASVRTQILLQVRHKSKTHWAKLKKKTGPKHKAMSLFDEFYGSIFGNKWEGIREGLLRRSKYAAVINNYGDPEKTMEYLGNRGAHCLRNLIKVQKEFQDQYDPIPQPKPTQSADHTKQLEAFAEKLHSDEIGSIYPQHGDAPEKLDFNEHDQDGQKKKKENINIINKTLDQSLAEAEIDESRIIDPSLGMTTEALYQFLPATKLKGMDDWIPESTHYAYYSTNTDFPLAIEPETDLVYPEHLKVFTYEMNSEWDDFPEPKRCQTGVFNYYPMDCGSVLAVLALGLQAGDRVLDMCSAPGGKALVALQTLLPDVVVCNDVSISRSNRTKRIFKDYLFDFETSNRWNERVIFKRVDGRELVDDYGFDKVLVDVPCTTDRHSVNEDENNIFRPDRIKERLKIPEMQSALLINALRLVKVGGTIVYSTCSLSPVQNDGVVHMSLKNAFESHGIIATVKDMTSPMSSLSSTLQLCAGPATPRYGQLVLPSIGANFGPTYISKLVRVK